MLSQEHIDKKLRRWKAAQEHSANHRERWQELADFFAPHQNDILTRRTPGEKRTQRIFDSTPGWAARQLATNLHGAMTNPATPWKGLEFEDEELQGDPDAKEWLEECLKREMSAYARSQLYQALQELYFSDVWGGTGCIYTEESPMQAGGEFAGFQFGALPLGSYEILDGPDGQVNTVFRTRMWSPRQAAEYFGPEALPEVVRESLDAPLKADKPDAYLHIVEPRDVLPSRQGQPYATDLPWQSCYLHVSSKKLVRESGYHEFPYCVVRWDRLAGSPWGFGPGELAYPDAYSLNTVKQWGLKALPLRLFPPSVTDDESVIGRFDLTPGAVNTVRRGATITPYNIGGSPEIVQFNIEELQAGIRRVFHVDQLSAVPEKTDMTAFEVAQRVNEMRQFLGPTFYRLTSELFNPLSDRTFGIMLRAGAFPAMPDVVAQAAAENRGRVRVLYQGPLAKAQRAGEIEDTQRFYVVGQQIADSTQDPSIWDNVDHDKLLRNVGDVLGIIPTGLKSQREVMARRQARQAAAQAQVEAEQQVQASQAAKNTVPLLREIRGGRGGGS